jgi:hypothetical protein
MTSVHPEYRSRIAELLDDARLVFDYGIRVGRLPDDSLARAIDTAERSIEDDQRPDVKPLAAALGDAVKAIAPITLLDLRFGNSPFHSGYQTRLKRRQYRLVSLTVFLAVLIAYYSIALHREENALHDLQEIQNARIIEKTASLRKLVQQEEAFSVRDSRYDQYRQLLGELRDLEARRQSIYERVDRLSRGSDWPIPRWATDLASRIFARGLSLATNNSDKNASTTNTNTSTRTETPSQWADICTNVDAINLRPTAPQILKWIDGIGVEQLNEYCFLKKVDLGYGVGNYASPFVAVSQVRDKILLQSAWILPFLSGLLGAAVYMLRDALDPRTATVGSTLSIVRLAMGGIAGIIIGWFWAPTNAATASIGVASSVPFALAFITGFSIEILFSVLDRVNRTILDETVRRKGSPEGSVKD